MFDRNIDRFETKDGKLYLYDDRPANLTRIEICRSFPAELFQHSDGEVMQAVLDYLSGDDALGWMFEVTQYFFASKYELNITLSRKDKVWKPTRPI
jgi:hypothetical protein